MKGRDTQRFSGVFPALPTSFDPDGQLCAEPLRILVRDLILQDADGFYALGSTGETLLLSVEERKAALETIVREARGEAVVIAHVGAASMRDALELASHAAELGADALSSAPPLGFPYSFEQVKGYYDALCATGLPVLVCNEPSPSGAAFTTAQLLALLQDSRILGVVQTAVDCFQLERLRAACPDAVLLNGFDGAFLAGQVSGCNGGVCSTGSVMPAKMQAIRAAVQQGDFPAAARLQQSVNNVVDAMRPGGEIAALKAILQAQEYDFGGCRPPFTPLLEAQQSNLLDVCEQEGLL